MKYIFLSFLLIFSTFSFSQKKLSVVKATSKAAVIYEEGQPVTKWNLSPETKIDTYTTNKLIRPTLVWLKTDIDSISFTLKAGEHKDFIVLLNGKDSCYTRFQSPVIKDLRALKPEIHDTIALGVNKYNTNYIMALVNKTDTLNMNFDTGATEMTLTEEALSKKIKNDLDLYNTFYDVKIGKRAYKTKIYDIKLAGHETDGLIGWDLFDGLIVELNYDKNIMVIHSKLPKNIKTNKTASKFNIKYFNTRFFIEAQIAQGEKKVKEWFLFDTGYQKTVMLDNDLLGEQNFPVSQMKEINKVIMYGTLGNEVPVITANLECLKIGKYEMKNIPVQIMTSNKTMFGANIHILGNEILKRFNTFLDFQDNVVYLLPNDLYDTAFD